MAVQTLGSLHGEPVHFSFDKDGLHWTKVYALPGGRGIADTGCFGTCQVLTITPAQEAEDKKERWTVFVTTQEIKEDGSSSKVAVPDIKLESWGVCNPPTDFVERYRWKGLPEHLDVNREDLHFIVSSKAGTGKADSVFEEVVKPLLEGVGIAGEDYQVLQTEGLETVYKFAERTLKERACKGVKQTVILLGGDGGVSDLLNGLAGAERISTYTCPQILLFPLGTGNALFHSLKRPQKNPLYTALVSLISGKSHPLPHFIAEFSAGTLILPSNAHPQFEIPLRKPEIYGAVVASYGFHSTLVADSDTPELRKFGDQRFQLIAAGLLKNPQRYKARVRITRKLTDAEVRVSEGRGEAQVHHDGRKVVPVKEEQISRTHHAYILCTLVSNLEKTFTISPHSEPLDGKLRIVHFDSDSGEEIMDIMAAAYDGGKHVSKGTKVGYEEVESVKIDFEEEKCEWLRVCVDGLIVRVEEGGWMKVKNAKKGEEVLSVVV